MCRRRFGEIMRNGCSCAIKTAQTTTTGVFPETRL